MRRFYVHCPLLAVLLWSVRNVELRGDGLRLVSGVVTPSQGVRSSNGDSLLPVSSSDGRFVLFASTADNLSLTTNGHPTISATPSHYNIYLRDRQNNRTTLVSFDSSGTAGASDNCTPTGISADGRYALFESSATNLVSGATNGLSQIFIRDLLNANTILISIGTNGVVGNGSSRSSMLTPDGRFVAFASEASNLVPGDTNGIPDVFVRDIRASFTILASPGAISTNINLHIGGSESPVITPDGRYVAFYSTATNVAPQATPDGNIYLRDVVAARTTWVSAAARSTLKMATLSLTNPVSHSHVISADGRYIAYVISPAPPIYVFGGPSINTSNGIVVRFDRETGMQDLITTNCYVPAQAYAGLMPAGAYADLRILDMTPDGRFVAYVGNTNGFNENTTCLYVWDAVTGVSVLASGDLSNSVPSGTVCQWPVLDANGDTLVFFSTANLTTNAASVVGSIHLYARDLVAQATISIDLANNGVAAMMNPASVPRLSDDGRLVFFDSPDDHLVSNDANRCYDVFVCDLARNSVDLVSIAPSEITLQTANGSSTAGTACFSKDGRFLVFESEADNLVANDTNGCRDVFVRDLATGSNILVSVDAFGISSGNGVSYQASISGDGRYVLFTSSATNLVSGDTNNSPDIFVRDLQAGLTRLLSTNLVFSGNNVTLPNSEFISEDGTTALCRTSRVNPMSRSLLTIDLKSGEVTSITPAGLASASISDNGRFVACINSNDVATGTIVVSAAMGGTPFYTNTDLEASLVLGVSPDGNTVIYASSNQVFGLDHASGTLWRVSGGQSGVHERPRFSADGRLMVYAVGSGPASPHQVYLYDFLTRTTTLVSHRYRSGLIATGNSDSPVISPDGRFIAFRSDSNNIVFDHTNTVPDVFIYDRSNKAITLVTTGLAGEELSNNRSLPLTFSPDGSTLVLQSSAGNLVNGDFNQAQDLFVFTLLSATIGAAPDLGPGFWLSWPVVPGKTYSVQYKSDLQDASWSNAAGTVTNFGTKLFFSDSAPSVGQRFYRVTSF
jgi:Tol biopolymer transport system component